MERLELVMQQPERVLALVVVLGLVKLEQLEVRESEQLAERALVQLEALELVVLQVRVLVVELAKLEQLEVRESELVLAWKQRIH